MARMVVTKDDLSPVVEILTWFLLSLAVLAVVARIIIKLWIVHRVNVDDYLVFGSLAQYAAEFLFITSLALAKLSLVSFFRSLTPVALYKKSGVVLGALVIGWAVTAEVAGAFQCRLPEAWRFTVSGGVCFDRVSMRHPFLADKPPHVSAGSFALTFVGDIVTNWLDSEKQLAWLNYTAALNILTEVGLIVLPLFIVGRLQLNLKKKLVVLSVFLSRIVVIAALICQLLYQISALKAPTSTSEDHNNNANANTNDVTYPPWRAQLSAQFVQCLAIVTTCMVYLKPFMDSLESGFIRVDDLRRRGDSTVEYARGNGGGDNSASNLNSNGGSSSSGGSRGGKGVGGFKMAVLRGRGNGGGVATVRSEGGGNGNESGNHHGGSENWVVGGRKGGSRGVKYRLGPHFNAKFGRDGGGGGGGGGGEGSIFDLVRGAAGGGACGGIHSRAASGGIRSSTNPRSMNGHGDNNKDRLGTSATAAVVTPPAPVHRPGDWDPNGSHIVQTTSWGVDMDSNRTSIG
ncbi:Eukaryotic translation initiation factor 2A [Agyrium rufum]|nr:Eukaryotic translation initiation factor 2A [Agyrium rufum]